MRLNLVEQLKDVISDEFKIAIDDMLAKENINSNAELILHLCRIVTTQIDIVLKNHYFYWSKQTGVLYKRGNQISDAEEQKLMVFAAQLIYTLRTFIHNEEITFHMASRTADGKYQNSAFIPQQEILSSFSAVSNKGIEVTLAVQRDLIAQYSNDQKFAIQRKNMWNQVEYLADPITGRASNKIDVRKPGAKQAHWAYQNLKSDLMVYIAYHGNGNYTKYYDMEGNGKRESLMFFNNGWLWEWYNKILYGGSDEEYLDVSGALMRGSLRPIMLGPDYTPGTKEGDFQDLYGRQIQSKYGNTKIISYNNIRHILYDLEGSLVQYIAEGQKSSSKLIEVLQEHFFPEAAMNGDKFANEIADDLLKKFNELK